MIYVRVNTEGVKKHLGDIARGMRRKKFMGSAGEALRNALASFYEGKQSTFWAQFSPNFPNGFRVTVTANRATATLGGYESAILSHKIYGGPVFPRKAGALAIPLIPEARRAGSPRNGMTPRLFILKTRAKAFLASEGPGGGKSRRRAKLWYILLQSVIHRPDPNARPTNEYIRAHVLPAVREEVVALVRGRG